MSVELRRAPIEGVFELLCPPFMDTRGAFLNVFRAHEQEYLRSWADRGIAQVNFSRTDVVGTIRGLHLQLNPHSEAKLVRCLKGKVWDVAVDLRSDSSTYGQWHGVELTPESSNALLVPEGCAHGFQVLDPESELLYLHSGAWVSSVDRGVRWDDPQLAISWPLPPTELSERDRCLPLLSEFASFLNPLYQ